MSRARWRTAARWPAAARQWLLGFGLAIAAAGLAVAPGLAGAEPTQIDFATAEQAIEAFIAAVRSDDQAELLRILGPSGEPLIRSGDPVADREARLRLVNAYDAVHRVEAEGANGAALIVGPEQWSLPIPLVKQGTRWHFDTDASAKKIIDRRIGRNELNVIEVCRAYVAAQREYASRDRLGDGVFQYAPRFASTSGKHEGLYWEAAAGQEASPLGPLVARARAEGYPAMDQHDRPVPYHGYYYRILTRQGVHAPGGAKDYIVAGHMTAGFALVAFPAKWGDSGIMTFLVNQDGIVFEKNFGPDTERLAREITEYDPDLGWSTP
jgi:DUF2950 family protein